MRNSPVFVYILTNGSEYKIGIAKDVERRIKQLQTGCATPIHLVGVSPAMDRKKAQFIEKQVHKGLRQYRQKGEWFGLQPRLINVVLKEIRANPVRPPDLGDN